MKNKKTQARLQLIKHLTKRNVHQAEIARIIGIRPSLVCWYQKEYKIIYPKVKLTALQLSSGK